MEQWNGTALDINATCTELRPKCLQLFGVHALSGCVTTSYLYGKGKQEHTQHTFAACAACPFSNFQITLWKAADQQAPTVVSVTITDFGWEFKNDIPVPVMATTDQAPPELVDVIRCQCRAQGKKCSTLSCRGHKEHLTCTSYCNCHGEDGCYNPYTQEIATTQAADPGMEEAEEQHFEVGFLGVWNLFLTLFLISCIAKVL